MQRIGSIARNALLAVLLLAAATSGLEAGADTIELRRSVRMPGDRDALTLADVATLSGAEAEALGSVIVLRGGDSTGVQTVSLESIRKELDAAGIHWGRVHLSGRDVVVRPRAAGDGAPQAMQPLAIAAEVQPADAARGADVVVLSAAELQEEETVRGIIVGRVMKALAAEPERLRLQFRTADHEVLATPVDAQHIEIVPKSTYAGDRIELCIRFWSEGRILREESVHLEPALLCRVFTTTRDVSRSEVIGAGDLASVQQWLPPSQAGALAPEGAIAGQLAARTMRRGEVVRHRDLAKAHAIHRGDRVMVRCLAGGIAITFHAEACGEGAAGDQIELRKLGERESFFATVIGAGEAIIEVRQ